MGTLVGKTLLTSTSNPYAAGGGGVRLQNTPAALDVFGIQVRATPAAWSAQACQQLVAAPPWMAPGRARSCWAAGA